MTKELAKDVARIKAGMVEMAKATPGTIELYAVMQMDAGELAEAMTENLSGENLTPWDLTRVKVPAGGGLTFNIPDMDDPDGTDTKVIEGVIIHHQTTRCYYSSKFAGGGSPPECSSADGVNGVGEPGGQCHVCPLNVFGTAPGDNGEYKKGKACREQKVIYVLTAGNLLPMCLVAPPSSLKRFRNYMLGLTGKAVNYSRVITEISLTKEKSGEGIEFSELFFKFNAKLPGDQATMIKMYKEGIAPALTRMASDFSEQASRDADE